MTIEQLNSDFGIADQLCFKGGQGSLPFLEISNVHAHALISVYAGQVLSYRPASTADDLMFLSEKAYYQTGKAIKGGTPICWPWSGPDPEGLGRASHGFVRNRLWSVLSTTTTPSQETKVTLGLTDTAETREIWPHAFELSIEITVGKTLTIELITRNKGDQSFTITQALHTYFKVGDIASVKVSGLEDTKYIDKVDAGAKKSQSGLITIAEEVDRVYMDVPSELVIEDPTLGRNIRIKSTGSKTAIVWNPWSENAIKMGDLEDDDYKKMICVETANAANDVITLAPGTEGRLIANYGIG